MNKSLTLSFIFLITNIYPVVADITNPTSMNNKTLVISNDKVSDSIHRNITSENFEDTSKIILNLLIDNLKSNQKNDLNNAFLLVLLSACLEKDRDSSSYQAWNIAINIYAKNNTSWSSIRNQIDNQLNKYNLDEIIKYLDLKNYYGPELDFKRKNFEIADSLKTVIDVINGKKNLNQLDTVKFVIATPIPSLNFSPSPGLITKKPEVKTVYTKPKTSNIKINLIKNEMDIAKTAWKYFEYNYNPDTGMINSSIKYPFTTMWDFASSLAILVSAEKLGVIKKEEFDKYITKILDTTSKIKLYKNELPNREYKTSNAMMAIGNNESNTGSGWSAIDIGRTLIWFKIIKKWYPEYTKNIDNFIAKWNFKRLKTDEQMYGTYNNGKKETLRQEGRLGYEQYAAKAYDIWGINLKKALNYEPSKKTSIFNIPIIYDTRNVAYFTSEPFFLSKMEIGTIDETFSDLTNKIYQLQKIRWQKSGIFTAVSEDSVNSYPWFVYNSVSYNGKQWLCTNSRGVSYPNLKNLSTKTAFAWNAIFNDKYSNMLKDKVISLNNSKYGYYAGIYENDDSLNTSININTNAIILESLLYEKLERKAFLEN